MGMPITELAAELEDKLDLIGYPLVEPEFFNDIAMDYFLLARNTAGIMKEASRIDIGPEAKEYVDKLDKQEIETGFKILNKILNEPLFPEDEGCVIPMIQRSSRKNPRGLFVLYEIYPSPEYYNMLTSLRTDESGPRIIELIKDGKYGYEYICVCKNEDIDVLADIFIYRDIVNVYSENDIGRYFKEFDGKKPDIKKIVESVCKMMLSD